ARVEAMLRRCEEPPGRSLLTAHAIEFLFRLSIGIPLHGAGWLEATRERLGRSHLRAILLSRAVETAGQSLEDTGGRLGPGDPCSARLPAQRAFRWGVAAVLLQAGPVPPTPRWQARRLREVAPALLPWDEYWAWQTMAGFDQAHPERWIRRLAER